MKKLLFILAVLGVMCDNAVAPSPVVDEYVRILLYRSSSRDGTSHIYSSMGLIAIILRGDSVYVNVLAGDTITVKVDWDIWFKAIAHDGMEWNVEYRYADI